MINNLYNIVQDLKVQRWCSMKPEPPEPDPSLLDDASFESDLDPIVDETLRLSEGLTPDEAIYLLGTAFFNEHARLILHIGTSAPLIIKPLSKTFLGRSKENSLAGLYINLVPYDAKAKGVSRLHAVLHRTSITLAIQDLNSRNKTYVNGHLLAPHQVQMVHDGDELLLGALPIRIAFQYG
jgi:hypothetical protein